MKMKCFSSLLDIMFRLATLGKKKKKLKSLEKIQIIKTYSTKSGKHT